MLVKKGGEIPWSSVTPKDMYMNRRLILQGTAAGAALLATRPLWPAEAQAQATPRGRKLAPLAKSPLSTTGEKLISYEDITHYNNFYEFGTGKEQPATLARKLKTTPWMVSLEGEVARPRTFSIDEIMKLAPLEERVYRMRCVEGWSVVIPWVGYSLSALLKQVEPTSKARYVAFQTQYDRSTMWSSGQAGIEFPYVEGLRMDEAMHPLALLGLGLYGEAMPNQNGAPVRIVVPWKYGFKSIKSIVKIKLQEAQPPTTWNISIPNEYGFYSNVNPQVSHPRWSQAKELRLGDFFKRDTLMFNGYGDQVASLYSGMDLKKFY